MYTPMTNVYPPSGLGLSMTGALQPNNSAILLLFTELELTTNVPFLSNERILRTRHEFDIPYPVVVTRPHVSGHEPSP
jgi:hypothetical protein